jgi:hypothetical protein
MQEAVRGERDALRNLLAGLGEPTIDEEAAERRLE